MHFPAPKEATRFQIDDSALLKLPPTECSVGTGPKGRSLDRCFIVIPLSVRSQKFLPWARQMLLSLVPKGRKLKQHDLHSLRFSASLPESFRLAERTFASPFLTLPPNP